MKLYIKGGKVILDNGVISNKTLVIEDKILSAIIPDNYKAGKNDRVFNATGKWVIPGLIDLHAHGALGKDAIDGTVDDIKTLGKFFAAHGVTSYLPTIWTSTQELMTDAVDCIANCPQPWDGARHLGVHIEGPYLNIEHRGAQIKDLIRRPDPKEYMKWIDSGAVRLVTIAPEIAGALEFIDKTITKGVKFSIGHSGASYEQVIEAADHGLNQATHIFNGMSGLHHREPGTAGGILMDRRIYAQIIADGVHVHPAIINLTIKVKGISKIILISDSIRGTGLLDGYYDNHGQKFVVRNGIARNSAGVLCGSTLTLDKAVKNIMKFTGIPLNEILPMATSVPAEAMGWNDQRGVLKPGADADVVILDEDFNVLNTFILGNEIYSK